MNDSYHEPCVMVPQSDWLRRLDERDELRAERDALAKRVEELTEEAKHAQQCWEALCDDETRLDARVRELEALVVRRFELKTLGDQGQLDVDLYAEGQEIAERRAGGAS